MSRGDADAGGGPGRDPGAIGLWAVIAAEVLLLELLGLPNILRFSWVAFEDLGGTLKVQHLLDEGYRPAVDFYYPYGLLPLLVARGWFWAFGRSYEAYVASTTACNLAVAWGLARAARALCASPAAVAFLLAAVPYAVRSSYLNLTHALEAALLCLALAEHARGRRGAALVLTTACAFVKPTMAYVYGALLLALSLRDLWRRRATSPADWARALGPAAATAAATAALLVATFGAPSFLAIQVPVGGSNSYQLLGYGFFRGAGRDFWHPAGARPGYYLGTPAGFWIASSLVLVGGGLAAIRRLAGGGDRDDPTNRAEVLACCATMHAAFVCLFYGVAWDWQYYTFLPVLGIVAMIRPGRPWAAAAFVLAAMALLGLKARVQGDYEAWTTTAPGPQTAGLWAGPEERAEWEHVLELTRRGPRPLIVSLSGCADLLFPRFEGTDSWYLRARLVEPLTPPAEKERVASRLRAASTVVIVRAPGLPDLAEEPRFERAMAGCDPVWRGESFAVYRRDPSR